MSFELLLVIPLLLLVLLGGIELSQMLMAGQAVQAAASNGAREASMPGSTEAGVRNVVRQSVLGWRFESDMMDSDITIEAVSLATNTVIPLADAETGDVVTVSIEVDAADAVPDFLKSWGLSLVDRTIGASAIFRRE